MLDSKPSEIRENEQADPVVKSAPIQPLEKYIKILYTDIKTEGNNYFQQIL